jgi:hypothetical protein
MMVYHVWNHLLTDFVHRPLLEFICLVSGTGSIRVVSHPLVLTGKAVLILWAY